MLLYFELHGFLTKVESFLMRARATLGMSLVMPEASPSAEGLYGDFYPSCQALPTAATHVFTAFESEDISNVRALMMLIMPLQDFVGSPLLLYRWCILKWTCLRPR
jgi:hypothetical protein